MKKYEIVSSVDGDLYLSKVISVSKNNMTFTFIPDHNHKVTKLQASISIPEDNKKFEMNVSKDKEGIFNFVYNTDEEIYSELITEIQSIESHLSFKTLGALKSINYENPENKKYILQQNAEGEDIEAYSISFKENNNSLPFRVSEQLLQNIVKDARVFDEINSDVAFWRIGMGHIKKAQYKLAYIHFYFIVENLYSNGFWREENLLIEFKKSSEFLDLIQRAYEMINNDSDLKNGLEKTFGKYCIENNLNNIPLLLIRVRNDLHHYHRQDPRSNNTPFLQADYRSIALLIQTLTFTALFINLGKISEKNNSSL